MPALKNTPMRKCYTVLCFLAFFYSIGVEIGNAQSATIQGIIHDGSSGQPLEGANVILRELESENVRGVATDPNGFYHISNINPGKHYLRISFVGYIPYSDTLSLGEGERSTVSIELEPDEEMLDELVVAPTGGATRLDAGRQQISTTDLSRVPTPAGSGDLASYLLTLPGVVATGDRGGQLYIRGGTPSQNMVLIDGTLIYQPFHILGFFSAFPEDLVSSTDFYAGGFGPKYTGRISSVMDIKMRDGNSEETKGSMALSPFLGEIIVEGPLKKGRTSMIGSVRRSLIEDTSPTLLGEEQPLKFDSQYFKISFFGKSNSRCSIMGMRTYDQGRLDYEEGDTFSWKNVVGGAECVVLPEGSDLLFDINAGFSYLSNEVGNINEPERYSNASRFNLDLNLTRFLGNVRLNYGAFVHLNSLSYALNQLATGPQENSELRVELGGYLGSTIPIGDRFQLSPGASFYIDRETYVTSFEPRIRGSWQPFGGEKEELSFAVGLYRQPIAGITDKRDAGSVFTAWMPVPVGEERMEAVHALLGWRQLFGEHVQFSVEGYHKRLQNLPVPVWSPEAQFTTDLAQADGWVYGSDLRLEINSGRGIYGFVGYGYSWTEYETRQDHFEQWFGESTQRYHPLHDRRHQVNAQLNIEIGEYTAGVRWQLGTGLPFTKPMGFDEQYSFEDGLPNVKDDFGNSRVIMGKPFQGRLPNYHRLDVSLKRSFELPVAQLEIQLGAINSYDQVNLFYYDVYKHQRFNQLPLVPYLSLKLETK
ncbi:TonB-dependent receptor [Aliifodinibius sp. S!AR15-10]|uniref:TonB-dependent receptor n=1 Tax=Aliifodinibius sp. S!AR15-10 TaxID=2950437 RepID=UPI002859BB94|nr:TonB-dependent receptor [Aliifodinibius sp. S!AR15-10]MDR8392317.1 TonB-dependent receptor [Aliifodinibius sp. S!AR15-10]